MANYILWRIIESTSNTMATDFRNLFLEYSKAVYGIKQRGSRWKTCVGVANGYLSRIVSAMYVRKHFNQESKKSVMTLVRYVRNEFVEMVKSAEWMDSETKKQALSKAREMGVKMGFPDEVQ